MAEYQDERNALGYPHMGRVQNPSVKAPTQVHTGTELGIETPKPDYHMHQTKPNQKLVELAKSLSDPVT